ncbi:MAG: YihY/virulence factor BrkB family protein [Actinomycetota bacterium]|nr:YihY/virulence factor BrkB family protein [Actinomycetota bacterium]
MEIPFGRYLPIAKELQREVTEDRVTGLAAEIAFFGVLSIFPGLLMVVAAIGSVDAFVGSDLAALSKRQIVDFLNLILTNEASGAIDAVEDLFQGGSEGLLTFATVAALVGLSRAFAVVAGALNLAYDADERRPWLKRRLLGLGLSIGTVLMTVFMLVMIVVGPLFGAGAELADLLGLGDAFTFVWNVLRWPAAFALLVAWATTLFHLAPCRPRPHWRVDLPGALLTAVLWLVVSLGLNLYLQIAGGSNPVFSVLGGGLILLVWLYLLSLSLLIGGELNPILDRHRAAAETPP